jgi:geranylgeranyl reductase family protein
MSDVMYDVIVAGGGPGGSTAATVSAMKGLKTLLLDYEEFPREKPCGDAVPSSCIAHLKSLGMGPFDPVEFYGIDKVMIQGPKGAQLTVDIHTIGEASSCIVSRLVFDTVIHDFAIAKGAEPCQMRVTAPIVENGQVVGVKAKAGKQEAEFRGKIVIAADGATSVLGRALKSFDRPDNLSAVARRGYIETDVDMERLIEFVFLDEIQPGYAWFFPMSPRRANIGVGMRSDHYKKQNKTLDDALNYYLKSLKARIGEHHVTDIRTWQVPLFTPDQKRTFNGAMLIGDAGGFVDPLTGAGINAAVMTGTFAAQAAYEAISANNLTVSGLASYDRNWQASFTKRLRRSMLMHQILSRVPSVMDGLISAAHVFPPLVPALLGKLS